MTRIFAVLAAGMFLTFCLAACGGSEDNETTSPFPSPAAQPTSAPEAAQTPTAAPEEPAASAATDGATAITVTEGSEALYRINEQFLSNDAVGTTSEVEGQIVFQEDGSVDAELSKITVGVRSLSSDSSRRDSYIQGNSLESNKYPEVTLAVKEILGLAWPLPTSGEATFGMVGNLTIRNQTHSSTWVTTATFTADGVEGLAKTVVTFEQYGMTKPSGVLVISVAEEIRLEISFVATVSGG